MNAAQSLYLKFKMFDIYAMLFERLSLLDPFHRPASPKPDGFPDANGDLHTDSES